ncbi:MAG: MotA/TolQ/ExbB proton channel family protein [Deltaproteobacteria bacterium]|nr:MotA/TolQ/ExbB proton channel family protein [Deltaproteobacteria bacterium]
MVEGLSVLDMIRQGALVTYPLIAMSIVVLTIIGERLWALRGLVSSPLRVAGAVVGSLQKGDFRAALAAARQNEKTPAGRIFRDVISQQDGESLDYLAKVVEDRRFEEIEALKGGIWVLGTVGVSAPFIGLLGTVIGIIKSFHNMSVQGSGGFAVVAGGISEALIATALGLAVAIIAVIFYNYFHTKLERIEAVMTIGSDRVLEALRLGRKTHGNG